MAAPEARLVELLREPAERELVDDRFRIEREAGIGGMGIVYRAVDESSGAVVALKVLRKTDAASRRRFGHEVQALERLSHPAIVRYVAHGIVDDDQPYLAMEWVEGETLSGRLEGGPLSVASALSLALRVASALRAAHALGIIHRDIKPGNVLLPEGDLERAKVADFGLSRFLGAPHATTSGAAFGTPGYAAPEQVRGGDIDGRADLFSLGCLLFRCLTNTEAFAGAEVLTVIAKLVLEEPPRVKSIRNDVPDALDSLIARLLCKDAKGRPASADEVISALENLQKESPEESSPIRKKIHLKKYWVATAAAMALAAGAFLMGRRPAPVQAEKTKATLVTDLVASATCRPDAALDYREGLQALREATPERAYKAFERAMGKDPACPEVLLRVLQTGRWMRPVAEQREHLHRVLVHREALSERDRVLLDSLAATIASEPADFEAASRILNDGASRFPDDVELVHLAANAKVLLVKTVQQIQPVLASARRAVELDPAYADAWMVLGWTYERTGQVGEEANAYAHCAQTSPTSVECLASRVVLLRRRGLCQEAESLTRQWIARDPNSDRSFRELSALVAAGGAPRESIEETMHMRWSHLPDARRDVIRLHDRAKLAAWTGDFREAIALGEELERRAADDAHIEAHLRGLRIRLDALLETGKADEAGRLAEDFLRRKIAWTNSPLSGERTETGASYYEPNLLGIAVAHGRLPTAEWRTMAGTWEHQAQTTSSLMKMNPFETWTLRWGSAIGGTQDDAAKEAMKAMPAFPTDDPILPTLIAFHAGLLQAYEGRLRLAAGDASRAASLLDDAARSCQGTDQPFLNTRAHLWLGQAHEKLGHTREACEAYGVVMRRWGAATPASISAAEAAKRSRALGCVPL
ncbi:serine/threonine-protein kinase [Pendulispora brunnea]|uniref:Serine/threonine-protein kinase n=1 Tax=Pendulispora brunnea TaxID=2905690 RepID=A0ABZ2K2S1_9BACT